MSENQLPDVVKRLYRLEHENRLLKRWGTVLALGVVAIVIMGQTKFNKTANVIEAEKFVLRDANGKTRATLGNFRDSMGLHR
jgi:hypothetical protein